MLQYAFAARNDRGTKIFPVLFHELPKGIRLEWRSFRYRISCFEILSRTNGIQVNNASVQRHILTMQPTMHIAVAMHDPKIVSESTRKPSDEPARIVAHTGVVDFFGDKFHGPTYLTRCTLPRQARAAHLTQAGIRTQGSNQ